MNNTNFIKKFERGEMYLDLPYANCIYELPLWSFADMRHSFHLSLIYNRTLKEQNDDFFHIAKGYKLNLQKRLIYNPYGTSYFQEENGKCTKLHHHGGTRYTFDDDSQRMIHGETREGGAMVYTLDYSDGSFEEYEMYDDQGANGFKTRIIGAYDKHHKKVLSYNYNDNDLLSSIMYREENGAPMRKKIVFTYDNAARLSAIAFYTSKNNEANEIDYILVATIGFLCDANDNLQITHYSGVTYHLSTVDNLLTAIVSGVENNELISYARKCAISSDIANTLILSDLECKQNAENATQIFDDTIAQELNRTTYTFSGSVASAQNAMDYVEVTDFLGVKTRMQFRSTKMICSYEIFDSEEQSDTNSNPVFVAGKCTGEVKVYQTEEDAQSSQVSYTQTFTSACTALQYAGASMSYTATEKVGAGKGYFILSGWIRPTGNEILAEDKKINISFNTDEQDKILDISNLVSGKWMYFAFKIYTEANTINIDFMGNSNIQLADLRILYQQTHVQQNAGGTYRSILAEDVLIHKQTEAIIPVADIQSWRWGHPAQVYFADLLKFKINQAKDENISDFYSDHCRNIDSIPYGEEAKFTYGDVEHDLKNYHIGQRQIIGNKEILTVIKDDVDGCFMVSEISVNGTSAGSEKMDAKFDVIESVSDENVTTTYTRDRGLITSKTVAGATVSANYDEEKGEFTVTDEFDKQTKYTMDTVWGGVIKMELPDGSVIQSTYDGDGCALVSKTFGDAQDFVTHNLGYAGGNLTAMSVLDGIGYGFTYSQGELVEVKKAGAAVEQHIHAKNATGDTTITSYYPSSNSPLYSISKIFDKYGRLTSVDSTLSCVYDIAPEFEEDGTLITKANNGSAKLAMTVDSKVGETTRYLYTEDGQLREKAVTSKTNFATKKTKETFAYDTAGRLIEDELAYQSLAKTITSEIGYAANSATNDSVETYLQKIDGAEAAKTTNTYDNQHRVSQKAVQMGEQTITKNIYYDKTRVSGMSETLPNNNNLQDYYFFDALGRIGTETYSTWQSSSVVSVDVKGYEYDKLGQLVREDNQGLDKTMIYEYNENGHIIGVKTYDYTTADTPNGTYTSQTFTYGDTTHTDRLTAFCNKAITYNANGEMASFDGWSYSWSKGRLSGVSQTVSSGGFSRAKPNLPTILSSKVHSFTYNAFGQRVGASYTYTYDSASLVPIGGELMSYTKTFQYDHSGRLVAESCSRTVNGVGNTQFSIVYLYDQNVMIGMEYTTAGQSTLYYFQRNLQGDVIGIYDTEGNLKVRYIYDAWGNCTIGSDTADQTLAKNNPIRYRGYYYDTDIGLYYLNARYYSPELRRFISPDDTAYLDPENANGLNLYAYCCNDPVNKVDPTGHFVISIIAGLLIAVIAGAVIGPAIAADIEELIKGKDKDGVWVEIGANSVQIRNASKIKTPWVLLAYSYYLNHFHRKAKNILKGSTSGIVYEWFLHNLAAWAGIGEEGQASNVDLGAFIFSDAKDHPLWNDEGLQMNGVMSTVMIVTYGILWCLGFRF